MYLVYNVRRGVRLTTLLFYACEWREILRYYSPFYVIILGVQAPLTPTLVQKAWIEMIGIENYGKQIQCKVGLEQVAQP